MGNKIEHHKPKTVRNVCGVTQRTLEHWINTGIIKPSQKHTHGERDFFKFDFKEMVKIKIIKSLRESGVSLQKIKIAIKKLNSDGENWHAKWIWTDGKDVYHKDINYLETLTGKLENQLVFSVIALQKVKEQIKEKLEERKLKMSGSIRR
jgi:DNA-binding transcriptional MerR regulator